MRLMRFYILSDLHFGYETNMEQAQALLEKLCSKINSETAPGSTVLFIVLGDIIDRGMSDAYEQASKCFDDIKRQLTNFNVCFEIVPGNHDVVDQDIVEFTRFSNRYCEASKFNEKNTYAKEYAGVNFIFTDSVLGRIYNEPGTLDLEEITTNIRPGIQNVLFCHHAFTHKGGGDHDTVTDGADILKELEGRYVKFAFHGHTHRAAVSFSTDHIAEIGCGTLSGNLSGMEGVFHQFTVGTIRDGKIITVDRWLDTSDGGGGFAQERLYPKELQFADPRTVYKIEYPLPGEYSIPRKVIPHTVAMGDDLMRILSEYETYDLNNVLESNCNVLLLGDAGQGKSVLLKKLAHDLYDRPYFPFFYSLRSYLREKIVELLPKAYRELSSFYRVLVFDGYDELSSDYRNAFERQIAAYINDAPDSKIVISSRSNFCRAEKENKSKTFPGFEIFNLCELDANDIKDYLCNRGLNPELFFSAAKTSEVENLLNTPFYLVELADLFIAHGKLPPRAELMDRLIEAAFQKDVDKATIDLEDRYHTLFSLMEEIALSMQLMQRYDFDDRSEYQRLFSDKERDLAKHCGLLRHDGDGWQFTHNNFREYLVARYLSRLPQEVTIGLISIDGEIKPSWINTLGYLSSLDCRWNLLDWLGQNDPSALVKFERDRVSPINRFNIFKIIFEKYEETMLWLHNDMYSIEQLAEFSHSSETLAFLLDRISQPRNYVSQYNALQILRHFPHHLYNRTQETRECLIKCCEAFPDIRSNVCRIAIFAICQLELNSPEVTDVLMELFGKCDDDYIRLGMYEYLISTGEHDSHVSFFLEGIPYILYRLGSKDDRIGNELFELVRALKQMSTPESVGRVLSWFASADSTDFFEADDVFTILCQKAAELYLTGADELYDIVFCCYLRAAEQWKEKMEQKTVAFFLKTNTLEQASISAASAFSGKELYLNGLLRLAPESVEHIKEAYLDGRISDVNMVCQIVKHNITDSQEYEELSKLIYEKDHVELPKRRQRRDYEAERRCANQVYFDSLFEPSAIAVMIDELISMSHHADPTIKELVDENINFELHSPLRKLMYAMYHNGGINIRASKFLNEIVWERFILMAAKNAVEQDKILPSDEQKSALKQYLETVIEQGVFNSAVTYHGDGISVSFLSIAVFYFILYFDYPLEEETLLQLTEMPVFFFSEQNEGRKFEYLRKNLPFDVLQKRVIENANAGVVRGNVLRDHIGFCTEFECNALVPLATSVCKEEAADYSLKISALKYLNKLLGSEYIALEIVPCANAEFLLEINRTCSNLPVDVMRQAMEKQFSLTQNLSLLAHLIIAGSSMAIDYYIDETKRLNFPPDRDSMEGATDAIGTIQNPEFLPKLGELLDIVLSDEFVDNTFIELRSRLKDALVKCGKNAPAETEALIRKHKEKVSDNIEAVRFCSYILDDIQHNNRLNADQPKTIDEVTQLLSSLRNILIL